MPIRRIVYEVWLKGKGGENWFIYCAEQEYKKANNLKNRIKKLGQKSKVIEVVVLAQTVSR
jgi:hypothetical protein